MSFFRKLQKANSSRYAVAQTILTNAGIQGLNFFCGMITARTLAPAGRGTLAAVIMWPQFLAYCLTLGTPVSFIYCVKRNPELASRLSGAALALSLFAGLCASVIGWFVIPFSLKAYPPATVHFAQYLAAFAPVALCSVTLAAQVQSADSFSNYNIFRFFSPFSILLGLMAIYWTGTFTTTHAALVYLAAGIPAVLWISRVVWKTRRPTFTLMASPTKMLLHYGVKAWGGDLLGTVASQVDRILVVSLLNPAAMGIYVVAQNVSGILDVIPSAVAQVLLPRLAGMKKSEAIALTGIAFRITFFLMAVAAVILTLAGNFLLRLVYGSKFLGSESILPYLVAESIVDGMYAVSAQAFLASGFPGIVTWLQVCFLVSAVPLLYLLVPRWGVLGAAIALLLTSSIRLAVVLIAFPYKLKSSVPSFIFSRKEIEHFVRYRQLIPFTEDS